ncbi:unnamed protein product [Pelagomonas calceolata]|uniref:M7GpppX diphosphatase n=3 Tax=Pelagomonas calceolata TaxID=35677 RepID=A0A8J2WIJ0_9STRA|nr:unnamed protein product [Pelagomonas calceolata]
MPEPSDANKRQKPEDAAPAFSDTISNFAVEETLRFEAGGRLAVVLGKLDGRDCVLELKQRAALADPRALEDALPKLKLTLTNHSGAEYSYYAATDPTTGATYDLEAVWPAPERLVQRKRPAEICVVEETAEAYDRVVRPFAEAQAAKIGWIDAVCALEKERERNLHACDAFVVNVDTKWSTHGPFDADRATWRGADWTRDLYLLAISKDASLKSMRDLRGPDGAGLCRAMRAALLRCAADVYGVPATKLRVFFHYQPQFYRLHAHCTRAEHTNPGCECDRAHLLTTVAANLDLAPDYYARAPLTYKLRLGEKLHGLLSAGA